MTRFDATLLAAGKPSAVDLLDGLDPPEATLFVAQLAAIVQLQWSTVLEAVDGGTGNAPDWLQAAPGAMDEVTDTLTEFLELLDAYVPSEDGGPARAVRPATVPTFCNTSSGVEGVTACVRKPGHDDDHAGISDDGIVEWPRAVKVDDPDEVDWTCTICGHDASDLVGHEVERGHWPTFAS